MTTRSLAEQLLLQEEKQRKSISSNEINEQLTQIVDVLKDQTEILKTSSENFAANQEEEPAEKYGESWHPYQTGIRPIDTATSEGTYPNIENIFNALNHSPDSGWIQNFGPGLLFVVFQRDPATQSVNELRIEPYGVFPFAKTERNYLYNYIKLRTDVAETQYQIYAV